MRSGLKQKKRSREQVTGSVTVVNRNSYFSSDSLRLIFQSAVTRDLHAVQGVSHQFKKLAQEELQSRCGFIYRKSGDALISQVRIFFDNKKQLALEVKSNKHKLPIRLPIKNKKSILDGYNTFFISDNPLDITCIITSKDYDKDIRVDFLHDQPFLILKFSPNIESVAFHPTEGEVKLIDAIKANDTPTVGDLLKTKVSPNTRDCEGVPVLILAASHGDLENVKLLVTHGANLENRSAKGAGQLTALLTAAWRIVLEKKPLDTLHEYKLKAVIWFLIESGARVDAQSKTGKTILHYLSQAEIDNTKEISFLLSRGVDPTQADLLDRCPTDVGIRTGSFVHKNMQLLFMATIHITPALYSSHWSRLEDGSAYSIHFKPDVWSNKKYRAMDAFASKVKSVKTDDPIAGGMGLANDKVNFQFSDFRVEHFGDLPIPKCNRYAVFAIQCNKDESCITLLLHKKYKDNKFVHAAIEKIFQELKLGSSVELTTSPIQKKSRSVYESQLTQFKPASSSDADEDSTISLKKGKKF